MVPMYDTPRQMTTIYIRIYERGLLLYVCTHMTHRSICYVRRMNELPAICQRFDAQDHQEIKFPGFRSMCAAIGELDKLPNIYSAIVCSLAQCDWSHHQLFGAILHTSRMYYVYIAVGGCLRTNAIDLCSLTA